MGGKGRFLRIMRFCIWPGPVLWNIRRYSFIGGATLIKAIYKAAEWMPQNNYVQRVKRFGLKSILILNFFMPWDCASWAKDMLNTDTAGSGNNIWELIHRAGEVARGFAAYLKSIDKVKDDFPTSGDGTYNKVYLEKSL